MDNTELHFLTFDPEGMYRDMMEIYVQNGGEVLYPGDEKEILLRGVQAILVQGFAAADNAMRMTMLRYAVGEYLDLLGENRGCERLEAQKAKAKVAVRFQNGVGSVAAGEKITADGKTMYTFDVGGSTTLDEVLYLDVTAEEAGQSGNVLKADADMQTVGSNESVLSIICTESAAGGTDAEDDESYRERIRNYGLLYNTTGPKLQYESRAKAASSEIIDVYASVGGLVGDGAVHITLLVPDGRFSAIKPLVEAALNDERVRPLTDVVSVDESLANEYTLIVQYKQPAGSDISEDVEKAIAEYQKWQDEKIGRAFNPDRLMAALYNLGATRVIWGEGSNFEGEPIAYTELWDDTQCCKGTITAEVIT